MMNSSYSVAVYPIRIHAVHPRKNAGEGQSDVLTSLHHHFYLTWVSIGARWTKSTVLRGSPVPVPSLVDTHRFVPFEKTQKNWTALFFCFFCLFSCGPAIGRKQGETHQENTDVLRFIFLLEPPPSSPVLGSHTSAIALAISCSLILVNAPRTRTVYIWGRPDRSCTCADPLGKPKRSNTVELGSAKIYSLSPPNAPLGVQAAEAEPRFRQEEKI